MPSSAVQTCALDRKSTRLNSSHGSISYAVFCLKKKEIGALLLAGSLPAYVSASPPALEQDSALAHVGPRLSRSDGLLDFFFFNDTATTEIYTLSLHDALPICRGVRPQQAGLVPHLPGPARRRP